MIVLSEHSHTVRVSLVQRNALTAGIVERAEDYRWVNKTARAGDDDTPSKEEA